MPWVSVSQDGRSRSCRGGGHDQTVYIVVDDFGRNGRCYREADVEAADLKTVLTDLLDGRAVDSCEWSDMIAPAL